MRFKKLVSVITALTISVSSLCLGKLSVNAGNAENYSYEQHGVTEEEVINSPSKPSLTTGRLETTLEDAIDNPRQEVDVVLSGNDLKYNSFGLHVFYDERLYLIPHVRPGQSYEDLVIKGDILRKIYLSYINVEHGSFFCCGTSTSNSTSEGVFFTLNFQIPEDARPGDIFPIGIKYFENDSTEDQFVAQPNDKNSHLAQAWLFTRGLNDGYIKIADDDSMVIDGKLIYKKFDDHVMLKRCMESAEGTVEIPDSIDGLPVTEISDASFRNCINVTNVYIPKSVSYIGSNAFINCTSLEAAYIYNPKCNIDDGKNIFSSDVVIYGYTNSTAETYAENNFYKFGSLGIYTPETTAPDFEYHVLDDGSAEITKYIGSEPDPVIPSEIDGYSVSSIGYGAFIDCSSIIYITIPEGIKKIMGSAFYSCKKLRSIKIPESVEEIGNFAFCECSSLETIDFPDSGIKNIGDQAFGYCELITAVSIPYGTENIGTGAFYGCFALKDVSIPYSVSYISSGCFDNCHKALVISGNKDSYAETYAKENKIQFRWLDHPPYGDVDDNGKITSSDASIVLAEYAYRSSTGKSSMSPELSEIADVDNDGKITASDASMILGFYSFIFSGGTIINIRDWAGIS